MRLLLDAGADATLTLKDRTTTAMTASSLEAIKLLVEHGVDVNATIQVGGNVYIEGVLAADRITTGSGSFTVRYRDVWDLDFPSKGLAQFAQKSWETIHPNN